MAMTDASTPQIPPLQIVIQLPESSIKIMDPVGKILYQGQATATVRSPHDVSARSSDCDIEIRLPNGILCINVVPPRGQIRVDYEISSM